MQTWYLIQTKPNAHHMAEKNLTRQGYAVFLPLIEQTRRDAQRFRTKTQPLFPGYLFIGLSDGAPSWRSINATHGVSRAVSLDGQYRPVPGALIAGIKARCSPDGVFQANDPLFKGDQVQIRRVHLLPFLRKWKASPPTNGFGCLLIF